MYSVGELVVHKKYGVCKIINIDFLDSSFNSKEKKYYILKPVYVGGSKLFIPIDNSCLIRPVTPRNEALKLVEEIEEIDSLWIDNDKNRESFYKKALNQGEVVDWIQIIKTLYQRKQERLSDGKTITSIDNKYLKIAEDFLYGELAVAIGKEKDEMEDYFVDTVNSYMSTK